MKKVLLTFSVIGLSITGFGQNNNCSSATQVCNDVAFSGNSSGAGSTQELNASNQGCLSVEHQSSWYYFQPVTSGTVALTITTSVDYDFAIWATGNCNALGAPVRCSYSAASGNTGLAAMTPGSPTGCGFFGLFPCPPAPVSDVTEGAGGDKWVMPLNVVAGQTYIMLIDNFTANSTPFTLDWTFSAGATLNCTPIVLPLELLEFMAHYERPVNSNIVEWETGSERENDHFTLERSIDGVNWTIINQQAGAENSVVPIEYKYEDFGYIQNVINYYRLSQTDYNGTVETFDIISVDNSNGGKKIAKVFNTLGQEVPSETTGIVILQYEDGSTRRVFR
ncbi:MAG TPA: hypothetical protein VK151_18705 [Fluviicola sp.]|nr:hypothetical protein [Fluviicola sp.]